MGFTGTDTAIIVQGLPYLALLVCAVRQFFRERDLSHLYWVVAFTGTTLFSLLRLAGNKLLTIGGMPFAAALLLRLSLACLFIALYALFLLASTLASSRQWPKWLASAVLIICSSAVLLTPAHLTPPPQVDLVFQPLAWHLFILGSPLGGGIFVLLLFWHASTRFTGAIHRRLHCVNAGVGMLLLSLALTLAGIFFPGTAMQLRWTSQTFMLLAGIALLLGITTLGWLQRLWLLPELERVARLAGELILNPPVQEDANHEQVQTDGLRLILQHAMSDLSATTGVVQLWNPTQEKLETAVSLLIGERAQSACSKPADETLLAEVFEQQQALLRPGATRQLYLLRRHTTSGTMLAAPLVAQGKALGVLGICCSQRTLFAEGDLELLQVFASQMAQWLAYQQHLNAAVALERMRAEQTLKDDFIAVMAHELRTPLTVLKGRLQLLRRQLSKEGHTDAAEAVARLDIPFNRLKQLINTLLDVSYLDTGRLHVLRHALDLTSLVRKVVEAPDQARIVELELIGLYDEADKTSGGAQPVIVLGDSARLEQVLNTLLENARKYSPEESKILVRLERRAAPAEVVVSVRDFGIGIPPEDQPYIFQRWFRATNNTVRNYGGMGLGLYLSQEIINRHGGRMWVESSGVAGEGTTFFFALPLVSPQEIASLSESEPLPEYNHGERHHEQRGSR